MPKKADIGSKRLVSLDPQSWIRIHNIHTEADMLGKYVEKLLNPRHGDPGEGQDLGLSLGFLSEHGYA